MHLKIPFRVEPISDQAALGMGQDGAGCSGTGPKTAWAISGQSESSPIRDLLDPKRPGPARDQHYYKCIFKCILKMLFKDTF